jgi:hypothetical protein
MAALCVFIETLHAKPENASRIRTAAVIVAVCMAAAWICGGYWYIRFYPIEKVLILKGPWPWAHNLFMETKEHLFFVTAILAFLLPVAAQEKLYANPMARKLVLATAALVAITGLAVEGAGAVIDHGVKVALLREASKP